MELRVPAQRVAAFLTRSIRQESRLVSHHLMRGALAALILFMVLLQVSTASLFGAAGNRLASDIVDSSYWFLTLVGLLYFSVAITEEKEEDTLPLLRMTGVSNFGLLIGKSVPRLAIVFLFLFVVTPFLILSITMGGVVNEQLAMCILGLLCFAFVLSQIGLLASTVCRTSRRAFSLSLTLWILLEYGCFILMASSYGFRAYYWTSFADWLEIASSWLRERTLVMSLGDYLMANRGDSIWTPQMTFHLVTGICCFVLSWMLFEVCNGKAIGQGIAPEVPLRLGQLFRRKKPVASLRAVEPAIAWKSWRFILGGWLWLLVRLFGIPLFCIVLVTAVSIAYGESPESGVYAAILMMVGVAVLLVELARSLGRVLNDEVFGQTISSLCMLPRSTDYIVWMLVLGTIPIVIPAVVCFGMGYWLLLLTEPYFLQDTLEVMEEPWFWHCFTWVAVTAHLGLLFSTWLRYGGMLIAAAILWVALPVLFVMFVSMLAFAMAGAGAGTEIFGRYLMPIGLMMTEVCFCILFQRLIIARVNSVVGR